MTSEQAVSTHLDADTQRQQALLRLAEQADQANQPDPTAKLNYQYRLQAPITTGKSISVSVCIYLSLYVCDLCLPRN